MGRPMRLARVMRFESLRLQKDEDPDESLCVSKSELELRVLFSERYGRMSALENRIGSSASNVNAFSNSIVKRDETGEGIMELEMGDLMKLESGDFIELDASDGDPLKDQEDSIWPLEYQNPPRSVPVIPLATRIRIEPCKRNSKS